MNEPASLVIIQPALPEYRLGFFSAVAAGWPGEVVVAHGANLPGGVSNDIRSGPYRRVELAWMRTWLGMQLDWSAIRAVVSDAALVVVPGDPHDVTAHRLLAIRRLGGSRPVVAWSQYRGADSRWLPSLVKPWWHRFFDGLILYTHREAEHYLRLGHRADRLTWLDNGLSRLPSAPDTSELEKRFTSGPLVCLGRHAGKNRFDLAILGFAAYRAAGGRRRLLVIGDGPEHLELRRLANGLGDAVEFAGAIYDSSALDARLRGAVAALHPLAMGLSINTAFGYGLPVIACSDPRRHMPEFWIWEEGGTGLGFPAHPGRELESVPAIAVALQRLDALPVRAYVHMAMSGYAAVKPLTTDAMARRVLGLCCAVRSSTGSP